MFPTDFLIGTANAAHQVEGNNIHSDYWAQEQMPHSSFQEVQQQFMSVLQERFGRDKEKKLVNYRQQYAYIRKGETLFTGSSLMEGFPITEYCQNEGLPIAYNRGIGGYTTDEFLAAIDAGFIV